MGVKDLWQVLAPVCERKSLWELQGKSIAVDLSGWVCDSQNVAEYSSQPNMHLRNLFFRTSCLLLLGARPVFVLEGDAPSLKLSVMSQRNASRGLSQSSQNSGQRKRYKSVQKKCQELLQCMGVHCVQSTGEAEALCAILNAKRVVDGCISQDSDCFLYGAQVVYRNFTISASSGGGGGPGFSIDMYRMDRIEKLLGLSRTKLIALSLLCGCDYNQGGVSGVGKETAVKFLSSLKDEEVYSRFFSWRSDPSYDLLEKERSFGVCDRCGHLGKKRLHDRNGCDICHTSKSCHVGSNVNALCNKDLKEREMLVIELNIRKKAVQDDSFPSQDIINEFTSVRKVPNDVQCDWSQPNLIHFMKLAEKYMKWDECYSLEKFLPVVTRWLMLQSKNQRQCPIYPEAIVKARVLKGVASYEVKWADKEGLFKTLISDEDSHMCLTIEPKELFEKAFPELVVHFNENELAKKKAKQKGKTKSKKCGKVKQGLSTCQDCGKELPGMNQSCMCRFLKVTSKEKEEESAPQRTLEDLLDGLILNKKEENLPHHKPKVLKNSKILGELLKENSNESVELTPSSSSCFQTKCKNLERKENTMPSNSINASTKQSTKGYEMSFEEWTVEDFLKVEEIDLSDVVQSITGQSVMEGKENKVSHYSLSPTSTAAGDHCVRSESDDEFASEHSSDEETPYTPLIERVQKLQKSGQTRRVSILSSVAARRFSESFYAFSGGENATSSPKGDSLMEAGSPINDTTITFDLGVTKLLENTQ